MFVGAEVEAFVVSDGAVYEVLRRLFMASLRGRCVDASDVLRPWASLFSVSPGARAQLLLLYAEKIYRSCSSKRVILRGESHTGIFQGEFLEGLLNVVTGVFRFSRLPPLQSYQVAPYSAPMFFDHGDRNNEFEK